MKNIVLKRILTLSVISTLCFIIGIAYGIGTDDKMLLTMSVIICVVNLYKIWDIKRIEKKNMYIMISGKCVESSYNLVGRYRVHKIQSDEDLLEVSVLKGVKLESNKEYTFYFKEINQSILEEGKWIRNKLLSENFLGYEEINDERIN